MVDFNNETTVTTSPEKLIQILYLEERQQVIAAREKYRHAAVRGVADQTRRGDVWNALCTFWDQIGPMASQYISKEDVEKIEGALSDRTNDNDVLEEVWDILNKFVHDSGLTRIDSRRNYDGLSLEEANKYDGL